MPIDFCGLHHSGFLRSAKHFTKMTGQGTVRGGYGTWLAATTGASNFKNNAMRLTKTIFLLRVGLDVAGLCALLSAALSIAAYFWFAQDALKALFLHAFFPAFTGGVIAFGVARTLELLGLAYGSSSEASEQKSVEIQNPRQAQDTAAEVSNSEASGRSVVTRMLAPRAFVSKASDSDTPDGGPRAAGGGHA